MKLTTTKLGGALLAISFALNSNAQLETPQPSPTSTLKQKVGLTDVTIEYSRPGVKGRTIFGDLIPYGEIWRTGANASTKLTVSDDVKIGGQEVPAGTYALYTIPNETEWTIIIHKNTTHWGVGGYDKAEDLARLTVTPSKLANTVESLTIDFGTFTEAGAKMNLSWANTSVSFDIETNTNAMVEKQIKELLIDGPNAGTYYSAARYYLDNDKDIAQALVWIDKAIEKKPEAFWYTHQKAKMQGKLGMKKEAIATAKKSLEMAKKNEGGDYGYIANNQKLIAELKAKK